MNDSRLTSLEKLIDHETLATVLEDISSICIEKADHVETSYNDKELAGYWRDAARRIFKLSESVGL